MHVRIIARALLLLAAVVLSTVAAASGAAAGAVIGWIEVKPGERAGMVTIVPHVYALAPVAGKFALAVSRAGKGGTSNSSQSGAFDLPAGQGKALSSTSVNVSADQSLTIELKVFRGSEEIFSATLK